MIGIIFLASLFLVIECIVIQIVRKKHCNVIVTGTVMEMKRHSNVNAEHPSERVVEAPVFHKNKIIGGVILMVFSFAGIILCCMNM